MIVNYVIALPSPEPIEEPCGCFEVGDGKLSVAMLKDAWPFEGPFHFRAKYSTPDGGFVWLDLPGDESIIPGSAEGQCWVRALPLFDVMQPAQGDASDFELLPQQYEALRSQRVRGSEPWSAERYPIRFDAGAAAEPAFGGTPRARVASSGAGATMVGHGDREEDGASAAEGDASAWDSVADVTDNRDYSDRGGGAPQPSAAAVGGAKVGSVLKGFMKAAAKASEKASALVEKAAAAAEKAVDKAVDTVEAATAKSGGGGGSSSSSSGGAKGFLSSLSKGIGAAVAGATAAASQAGAAVSASSSAAAAGGDSNVGTARGHEMLEEED